jgi:HK97 family phage portal protein
MLLEKLFPRSEARSGTYNPAQWLIDWVHGGSQTLSGIQITQESALTISAVWRGINIVAGDVGKVPCYLYRRQGSGKVIADKHPMYNVVRRKPNPWTTAMDFKRLLTGHAILKGNGYAWIDQMDGRTILRQLDPTTTYPHELVGSEVMYITHFDGVPFGILGSKMLHIRNCSLDGIRGIGLVDKAKESLGLTIAAERYGAAFFGNSARPHVVIKYPTMLTKEKKTELREAWERAHQGVSKSAKTTVMDGGVDISTFGATNEESQFLATREFQIRDIANWIGVPPHMLGDTTRTAYASIEQENKSYLQQSLDYWLTAWEEECWEKLLTPEEKASDQYLFEFLRKKLIAMDAKTEAEVLAIDLNNGIQTLDEVRSIRNMQPLPNGRGELHRMPANIAIIGEDGFPVTSATPKEPEPPAEPADEPPADEPDSDAEPDEPADVTDDDAEPDTAGRSLDPARAVAVLEDAVRRCIRRLTHAATAAAKKPNRFIDWMNGLRDTHGHPLREAIVMPLWAATGASRADAGTDATQAADYILSRVFNELLDLAGKVTADQLEGAVVERMAAIEFCAADIAEVFITRKDKPS